MKKLNRLLFLLLVILYPVNILACPHVDSEGNSHLQTYNSDYTIMTMIYPEVSYLYIKEVYMAIEGVNVIAYEDNVISEQFGFPIYQQMTDYITYYWFLDDTLLDMELEDIDIDITVENLDSLYVSGDGYSLNVGLSNSYDKGITKLTDITSQIYYNINVEKLTDENNSYDEVVEKYNIELLHNEYFEITSEFMVIEIDGYLYDTDYVDIDQFYDEVEVELHDIDYYEDLVVINLDSDFSEEDYIQAEYTEDGCYKFTISEGGVYVLAKNISVDYEEEVVEEEDSDVTVLTTTPTNQSNNYIYYIAGGGLVVVGTITTIVVIKLKKTKR